MDNAIILARFWGIVFVVLGFCFLIRKDNVRIMFAMMKNETAVFTSGYFAVMTGIANIMLYNVWMWNWTLIVTMIGWMSVFRGVMRLIAPKTSQKMISSFDKPERINTLLVVLVIIGLVLIHQSTFAL